MSPRAENPAQSPVNSASTAPAPEPIRWFGTTWVERGSAYWLRRVGVSIGALVAAFLGGYVMQLAVEGVFIAQTGGFVEAVMVLAIVVCSCIAALRNWTILARGKESLSGWMEDDKSMGVPMIVGFVGSLVAYFFRSLVEAPGESVLRARYEQALAAHARRKPKPQKARPGGGRKR
ncbi:hypothetical protein [Streptacidiphilus fuscans]|uniref:Uncharacterized protein n=1 Tax=Streptacidiphilus fuscans TaxID=2789292 RepID=A0A931FK97_9ACTN|nr:hypothetical protein [Streptacidiphilus fuscans]MBF9073504.1 hypothetical protein [Streptacidiphilus fuscans]